MKNNPVYYLAMSVLVLLIAFTGCKKDDNSKVGENVKDYIEIAGGSYISSNLPSDAGMNMGSVSANSRALEGGSSPITISNSTEITHVLVAVSGVSGYYKVPVSELSGLSASAILKSVTNSYVLVILYAEEIPESFTLIIKLFNENTGYYSTNTEIDVTTLAQSFIAKLQVSLSFDKLNDIDLHLVEPNENEIYYGNEGGISYDWDAIYDDYPDDYDMLSPEEMRPYILDDYGTQGTLDLDSNASCDIDSINNENIIYIFPSDIQTGEYIVRVDFYEDCVGSGTTNYVVTARYDGELLEASSGSNPYYGSFAAGTDDYGDWGDGVEVMRFNINEVRSASARQVIYLMKEELPVKYNMTKIFQSKVLNK